MSYGVGRRHSSDLVEKKWDLFKFKIFCTAKETNEKITYGQGENIYK